MTYSQMFTKETVIAAMPGSEMEQVLNELTVALCRTKGIGPALEKRIRDGIAKKLEHGATGAIGHGVAVPHVKVQGIKGSLAVFGRTMQAVDFRAGDGTPVSLLFLVVGPEDAPEEHLGFMRWIAGVARNEDFRRFAMACKGQAELIDLLKEMDEN